VEVCKKPFGKIEFPIWKNQFPYWKS
jgi:hypothetical protein